MHHAAARFAISHILMGDGFVSRAVALTLAANLDDVTAAPAAVCSRAKARSAAMVSDRAATYIGPLLAHTLPSTQSELCAQLAPAVAALPADAGMQLAALDALASLWPHVASHERPQLRLRFLASLAAGQSDPGSTVSCSQLRAWQRDLPTVHGDSVASVASLKGLLSEAQPELVYRGLAEHLGANMDLPRLSGVVGALSTQTLLYLRDPAACLVHSLLGSVACERLCAWTPPEHLATLLCQLVHQLWWQRNQAGLSPVRGCLDSAAPPQLLTAVRSGDITAAQRAARAASKDPAVFRMSVWTLLDEWTARDDSEWLHALALVSAFLARAGDGALSPDDAACLATVFAEMAYREREKAAVSA